MAYVLLTDATLDIPAEVIDSVEIKVIPMEFEIDGNIYHHYPDQRELSNVAFYEHLRAGSMPTTAQVTPFVFEEEYGKYLEQGLDILCLPFSSGLSGTFHSGLLAAQNMSEKYPDRKIICLDSYSASAGLGCLVYQAAQQKQEGMEIDELADWVSKRVHRVQHWFCVDDLFHLKRGGRVSAAAAVVGSALNIKPVLSIDEQGKLVVAGKVRGTKKGLSYILDCAEKEKDILKDQTVVVDHADNIEMAEKLREELLERGLVKEVILGEVGPIIGTHVGPGMFALGFLSATDHSGQAS